MNNLKFYNNRQLIEAINNVSEQLEVQKVTREIITEINRRQRRNLFYRDLLCLSTKTIEKLCSIEDSEVFNDLAEKLKSITFNMCPHNQQVSSCLLCTKLSIFDN